MWQWGPWSSSTWAAGTNSGGRDVVLSCIAHDGSVPPSPWEVRMATKVTLSSYQPIKLQRSRYQVINLLQDISMFARSLPWAPDDLDIVIVRREGSMGTHHDFRVWCLVVLHALQWLQREQPLLQGYYTESYCPGTIARGGPITRATCSHSQSTTWA